MNLERHGPAAAGARNGTCLRPGSRSSKEHLMTELRQADDRPGPGARPKPRPRARPAVARARSSSRGPSSRRRRWPYATATAVRTHASPRPPGRPAQAAGHRRPAARQDRRRGGQPARPGRAGQRLHLHPQRWSPTTVDSISNGHETTAMAKLHERQIWLPVARRMRHRPAHRAGRAHADLAVPGRERQGRPPPAEGHPDAELHLPRAKGHLGDATYRLLQSIPTQPDALLAYLKAGKKWTNDDPPTEIGDLIRETIMPPAPGRGAVPAGGDAARRDPRPARGQRGRPGRDRHHVDQQDGQAGLQERVDLRQDHPAVHRRENL